MVNGLLADSACQPYVSRHDGQPAHLHYASEQAGQARRIQAYTAGGLAHLLCEDAGRMGVCAREDCAVVFVDTSRNGRRRYCSTRCATRVHVADHRARAEVLVP
jgi:predicted RNA-binding Zn ribbon-like protein